ncbi:hypothetical protein F5146DRAFT_1140987 [Armillaria mellea]|nr:hypothetical protein F5146DRAFT_1140987 [Armillaria mellea]
MSDAYDSTKNKHDGRISLTDIQSLFHCVVRFQIYHACPLQLSNDDIKSILQNWDTLKELVLNPSPTLAVVAEHGGRLKRLGLYLNGFADVPPRVSVPSFPESIQPKIGMSKLPSETKEAARFLSQLLTLQCQIHCAFMSPDHAGWGVLSELLEFFIRAGTEEQELARIRA